MGGFLVANWVSVDIEGHGFVIAHTRSGVGVDDNGGI